MMYAKNLMTDLNPMIAAGVFSANIIVYILMVILTLIGIANAKTDTEKVIGWLTLFIVIPFLLYYQLIFRRNKKYGSNISVILAFLCILGLIMVINISTKSSILVSSILLFTVTFIVLSFVTIWPYFQTLRHFQQNLVNEYL